jgi:hypothetical protein
LKLANGRLLALAAVIVFILAAIGAWPDSLADDVEPLALGLALFAGSFLID